MFHIVLHQPGNPRQRRQRGPNLRGPGRQTVAGPPAWASGSTIATSAAPGSITGNISIGRRSTTGRRSNGGCAGRRLWFFTKRAARAYTEAAFAPDDVLGLRQRIAGFARLAARRQPGSLPSHSHGRGSAKSESGRQRRHSRIRGDAAMRASRDSRMSPLPFGEG